MICILFLFSLFLPNLIYSSVTFVINPNCDIPQCKDSTQPALYYGNHTIGDTTNHIVYSSFDELTIMTFQTSKTNSPIFNYAALYSKDYINGIKFTGDKPVLSFTIVVRRLIEFDDEEDKGVMNGNLATTNSTYISSLYRNSTTNNETTQPSFEYQLPEYSGWLTVDVIYPGESTRDTKFPKLTTEPSSYFLNIAFQGNNYTYAKPRFAFELYLIGPGKEGFITTKTRFIDDQYTPGSFNVWQLKSDPNSNYPSSMLWKPVVYLSDERSIEDTTLMQVYDLQNNIMRDQTLDQGIFLSLYPQPYISAMNVSIGSYGDGWFSKENYGFLQFAAGLDDLKPDQTGKFVTVAVVVSFALPAFVGLIAGIFIIKRKMSKEGSRPSYNEIND